MGPSFKAFLKGLSVFLERTRSFASRFRHAFSSALRPCRHEEFGPVDLIHLRTEMNAAQSNPKRANNQNPIQGWLHPLCLSLGPSGCEERVPQPNGASLNLNKVAGAENICVRKGGCIIKQSKPVQVQKEEDRTYYFKQRTRGTWRTRLRAAASTSNVGASGMRKKT